MPDRPDTPEEEKSSESGDFYDLNVDLTNQLGTGSAPPRLIASPRHQPGVNHGESIGAEDNATNQLALSYVTVLTLDLLDKHLEAKEKKLIERLEAIIIKRKALEEVIGYCKGLNADLYARHAKKFGVDLAAAAPPPSEKRPENSDISDPENESKEGSPESTGDVNSDSDSETDT